MFFRKITNIRFKIYGYTSTHEHIQYRADTSNGADGKVLGRVKHPYVTWDGQLKPLEAAIKITPEKKREVLIFIDPLSSIIPDDLNINLRTEPGEEEGQEVRFYTDKKGYGAFEIVVRHEDRPESLKEPIFVKLCLRAADARKFSIEDLEDWDEEDRDELDELPGKRIYEFTAGPDKGDTWLGIDPGTTGSCIVSGHPTLINEPEELLLHMEGDKEKITPSRIAFDKSKELLFTQEEFLAGISGLNPKASFDLFETGNQAGSLENLNSFQSIKKLLGFPELKQSITFTNNARLHLSGVELTGLMVRRLFEQFKASLSKTAGDNPKKQALVSDGSFKPTRAVVAIPNNFSPLQIQDTVDAIKFIPGIKEVRTIHEAEAVLIYCVRYKSDYFNGSSFKKRVLIFDMGGATTNATNVEITFKGGVYQFQVTGKIGYAFGGDSIDYYLGKVIVKYMGSSLVKSELFGVIPEFTSDEEKKKILARRKEFKEKIITPLKEHLAQSYEEKASNLLKGLDYRYRGAFEQFFEPKGQPNVELDDEFSALFLQQKDHTYPIFNELHEVYESVKDAALDSVADSPLDLVIFSGRSTLFPKIIKTARSHLGQGVKSLRLDEVERKTSVAKGACLYGLLNNAFQLSSQRLFDSYGFTVPRSAVKLDVDFVELIGTEATFKNGKVSALKDHAGWNFSLQSNYVNFYRVSGTDPVEIIKAGQKHKFQTVGQIPTDKLVKRAAVTIRADGLIKCGIWNRLEDKPITSENNTIEISLTGENEPHYTWLLT